MAVFYTYLIGWKKYNKWYYGVRYSKYSNPNELWKTYFTSSKHVKNFRKKKGEPNVVEIRKVFDNSNKARLWEHKVLKKLKIIENSKWLNRTDNLAVNPEIMSKIGKLKKGKYNNFYGRKHTKESKRKMSIKQKMLMTEERRKKISEAIKRKHANGEYKHIYNEKTKRKISLANKGQIPWCKGKKLSKEHKLKISESEKRTKRLLKLLRENRPE